MNEINLYNNNLTELTEENLINLCHLNNIKPEELKELDLQVNELINLDFIQSNTVFINLKELFIGGNNITDINNIKYLTNLENLEINYLNLNNEKNTVELLKTMKKLKILSCNFTFKEYTKEQLKKELPNIKEIEK